MSNLFNEPLKQNESPPSSNSSPNLSFANIGVTNQYATNNGTSFPKEMKITSWMLFFISIIFSVLFA
jgi:hypothetical protein